MANPEALGPASLALGQAVSSFSVFLPKFTDVRQAMPNDMSVRKDVRFGEIGAVAMAVGIGVILSSISGQPAPTFVAVLMSLIIVVLYEQALRSTP